MVSVPNEEGASAVVAPRRPIRVLWLVKGLGPGGMERLLVNHARVGDRERFDYTAAYLVERPGSVVPELEAAGVSCVRLGSGRSADLRWLRELRRLVRSRQIDVVHAHSPLPAAMSRPLLRSMRHRPRLVYTEHNTWDCYGYSTRVANLATYLLDDSQLAVSADAAASPPSPLARRVEVLTHGIDLAAVGDPGAHREEVRRELEIPEHAVLVLTVANLRTEKAYDVLLRAAARVLEEHPTARFLAVGHGPLRDELDELHRRLGLGDRFRFLGFRPDAVRLMAAADVFALSSRQEGLPVAYMEASAIGLPAVVTSVGGLPDFVSDGRNGLVVPPERPRELAAAIGRLVADAALRAQLAQGSRAGATAFDVRSAVHRQEALYEELVA